MKRNAVNVCLMAVMILTLLAFAGTVAAQGKSADNMQIVLEKIKADKKLLVAQNMDLTEKEAKAFWPVYEQYQNELFLIRARTAKLIRDYGDNYDKMSNATARKLLDEMLTIEALGLKLRQAYLSKFRKVLPDVKVARYYQIENKIYAALLYELAGNIPLMNTDKK
jgi:hypothetical protein